MNGRLAFFLLLATLGLAVAALALDWRVTIPEETAARIGWRAGMSDAEILAADLAWHVNDRKIAGLAADAVAREDAADAMLWLDMARELGVPLAGAVEGAAYALQAREQSAEVQFEAFVTGFLTGESASLAGLAGAIGADLTVYGDLRDIVVEGGRMAAGEEYSEVILGLSVIGLAATVGTVATGGGGAVVKAGVSFMKFARRAGHMSAAFAARLVRLADEAIDMPALKRTLAGLDLADPAGSWRRLADYAGAVRGAKLFEVMGKMEDIRAAVGVTEALRLMKRIDRIEDVDDLHALSKVAGKRTRGVVELTGKTSFRAVKYTANALQIAFEYGWALALWVGSLTLAILARVAANAAHLLRFVIRRLSRGAPGLTVR